MPIPKTCRLCLDLFFESPAARLILAAGTLVTGMLFWANVYMSHAVSLNRLAQSASGHAPYVFDLSEMLIGPYFMSLGLVLAVFIPLLAAMVARRSEKISPMLPQKFLASLLLSILILLPSSAGFLILQLLKSILDSGMLLGAHLGLFLIIIVFNLISVFVISVIQNKWAALCAALFLCVPLWLSGLPAGILRDSSRGIIDLRLLGGQRINLAESGQEFISQHTEQVLRQFGKEPVRISAFLKTGSTERKRAENLLQDYARFHPGLRYKIYDPDRDPAKALQYRIDSYGATVVEAKGKSVTLDAPEEGLMTGALSRFLSGGERRVFFAAGYRQPGLAHRGELGYENLAFKIKSMNYKLIEAPVAEMAQLSADDLIILAGPRTDLSESEINILKRHFESGGGVLIAADPVLPKEGERVRAFLWEFGVDFGRDVVVDKMSRIYGVEPLVAVVKDFTLHPSVIDFDKPVMMPVTRSVRRRVNVPDSVAVSEIAKSGSMSWGETDLVSLENDKAEYDKDEDVPGPVPVACVIEHTESGGKMAVVGDSEWLNNANFGLLGNRDFFVFLLRWLFSEPQKTVLKADEAAGASTQPFVLAGAEHVVIFAVSVVLFPAVFLAALFSLFFRKRCGHIL